MKLYDLIQSVPWSMVETTLIDFYSNFSATTDHKKVFDRIKMLLPIESKVMILIEQNEDSIHVFGIDGSCLRECEDFKYMQIPDNDPRADELNKFALEFKPWNEWLGSEIHQDTLKKFTPEQIVAHCLYEMTLLGFDEKRIQEQAEEITRRVESIKSGKAVGKTYNSVQEMKDDILKRLKDNDK